ncbi:alkene reductase [Haliangium ochraceum]|uniref:NADH:flavin oxidoreductase/NADH oxidase n=1 Tax=Haliangium ochraceum (strain DSM 14365 / JCM 11303 / SMP-2) TaxID=502025 RepID=D0LTU7_HALO1|nr:alkene reductase [Haliangium ochraceum]ACY15791.1 NADH:flavin oxidoreductase/NADH oxidase [Haliangium ochraceum DSM 14365]
MSKLFEPYQLHDLSLKNRIALAPMTRSRAGKERLANPIMAEHYAQRCGAGLLITEATTVSTQANGWDQSPGIYTRAMSDSWKQVVEAVHAQGSRIFLQLWHTGRASHSSFHDGALPVAASAIKIEGSGAHTATGKQPHEVPRALETAEIPGVVDDFRKAAQYAKDAGMDGVELHAANGYLVDNFLQSKTNHRDDIYGGSVDNRTRFLKEIVEALCTVFPSNRVGVRLSPNGVYNDMGSPDFREQFAHALSVLDGFDLCYAHLMDGLAFGFHKLGEPFTLADARKSFRGPLIGNCGYTQEDAEARIDAGEADMIAFGRPFISNPDLVERMQNGWPLAGDASFEQMYAPTGAVGYNDFPAYQKS